MHHMRTTKAKGVLLLFLLSAMVLAATSAFAEGGQARAPGGAQVVGVFGKIPGKDIIVHVLVVLPPGADRNEMAREALRQQGARPWEHDEFSTTGLVWDQLIDADPTNDFVIQNYNPGSGTTEDDPTGGAGEIALLDSHSTWTNVSGSKFAFSYGGQTDRCPSLVRECRGPQFFDGNNDVAWLELAGCCTLGVTWFGTSIDEADMALNVDFDWFTNGVDDFDVETVFLHENGHEVGLGHSNVVGAVMEPVYAGVRRVLHQDDIDGVASLYPAVVDNPPAVSISSPPDGATVSGTVGVSADATDDEGVSQVEFFADGASIGTDSVAPYSVSWDSTTMADGPHTLTATATDTIGQTASDSIGVTVDNVDSPPTVSVTRPTNGDTVRGPVTLSADATDDKSVSQVEFFVDGASIGTDSVAPYSVSWDTATGADGPHTVTATATDTIGQTASNSISVTVDNTVPTVSITSPAEGAMVSGTIDITASAADATSGVAQVEFFADGVSIGVDTTAPYSVSWDTTTVTNGNHALTANAADGAGNIATSASVTATVDNPTPPPATADVTVTSVEAENINAGRNHGIVAEIQNDDPNQPVTITVRATVVDNADATISEVLSSQTITIDANSDFEIDFNDASTLPAGSYTVTITVDEDPNVGPNNSTSFNISSPEGDGD